MVQYSTTSALVQLVAIICCWWQTKSETFTSLCATDVDEQFTHGEVIIANVLALLGLVFVGTVATWAAGGGQ